MSSSTEIFITGGHGFVGKAVLQELNRQGTTNIRALVRDETQANALRAAGIRAEFILGDLDDTEVLYDAMTKGGVVIHAAGLIAYDEKSRKKLMHVNETGTAHMTYAALDKGVSRFVHISSIAALGRRKDGKIMNEETMWTPSKLNTVYAESKYRAEQQVWRAHHEGLDAVILNPSVVLGPGSWSLPSLQFVPKLYAGLSYYPVGGTGFVDLGDVAKLTILAMHTPASGKRYIVSSANLTHQQLFDLMCRELGVANPKIAVPPGLLNLAGRVSEGVSRWTGKNPILTRSSARNASLVLKYDNTRSKDVFNFSYRPIEETIAEIGRRFLKDKENAG